MFMAEASATNANRTKSGLLCILNDRQICAIKKIYQSIIAVLSAQSSYKFTETLSTQNSRWCLDLKADCRQFIKFVTFFRVQTPAILSRYTSSTVSPSRLGVGSATKEYYFLLSSPLNSSMGTASRLPANSKLATMLKLRQCFSSLSMIWLSSLPQNMLIAWFLMTNFSQSSLQSFSQGIFQLSSQTAIASPMLQMLSVDSIFWASFAQRWWKQRTRVLFLVTMQKLCDLSALNPRITEDSTMMRCCCSLKISCSSLPNRCRASDYFLRSTRSY